MNKTWKNIVHTSNDYDTLKWYNWIIMFYSNKEQWNLSVNEINSTVDSSEILFVSKSSLLSSNSNIFVIVESLFLQMVPLTWFIL